MKLSEVRKINYLFRTSIKLALECAREHNEIFFRSLDEFEAYREMYNYYHPDNIIPCDTSSLLRAYCIALYKGVPVMMQIDPVRYLGEVGYYVEL